jgi:hypothetical protein
MFAVERERFRKTVEDEVQIELAHDADIELSFAAHGVSLVPSVQNHDTAEMARHMFDSKLKCGTRLSQFERGQANVRLGQDLSEPV